MKRKVKKNSSLYYPVFSSFQKTYMKVQRAVSFFLRSAWRYYPFSGIFDFMYLDYCRQRFPCALPSETCCQV